MPIPVINSVLNSTDERPLDMDSYLWQLIFPFYCIGAIIKLVIDSFILQPIQEFIRQLTSNKQVPELTTNDQVRQLTTNKQAIEETGTMDSNISDKITRTYNLRKSNGRNRSSNRIDVKDKYTQSSESVFRCFGCKHIHTENGWLPEFPSVVNCMKYNNPGMLHCPCSDCQCS